jgi:hypothetical protein
MQALLPGKSFTLACYNESTLRSLFPEL